MKIVTFIASILMISCQSIPQKTILSEDQQLLASLIDENHVGVTAAYSIQGDLKWSSSAGYRDRENELPFTDQTITRIASLAKPMTAIALMQLVEKGALDLDVPIQNYIPDFPKLSQEPITTRHLLSHTSGMSAYKSGKEAQTKVNYPTLVEAMSVFKDRELRSDPGTAFYYTTYGYVVLGVIIEKVSGLSYEEYMQKNVWSKAGMRNTGIEVYGKSDTNSSKLYHKNKRKAKLSTQNNLSNRIPAGGFYTTITDVMSFGNAVLDNKLITKESFDIMRAISFNRQDGNKYGLGWFLYGQAGEEHEAIGHGGAQTGCNAQLLINVPEQIVVVCLSNTSGTGNGVIMKTIELIQKAKEEIK